MDFPRPLLESGSDLPVEWNRVVAWLQLLGTNFISVEFPLQCEHGASGIHLRLVRDTIITVVRLEGLLQRQSSPAAQPQRWNGSEWVDVTESDKLQVYGTLFSGVAFPEERVLAWFQNAAQRWLALGAGTHYLTGTLQSALASNATATLAVDVQTSTPARTVTVFGRYGSAAANTAIGALWNESLQRWDAALESCS